MDSREAFEAWYDSRGESNHMVFLDQRAAWDAAIAHIRAKLKKRGHCQALEDEEVWKP